MHQVLIVGSRVVAGLLGALAFYLAFFLYEDEEGGLQNRIDDLWIMVHERARFTQSTSTALFNKVGEVLINMFGRAFGKRLFSFRSLVVSLNLSLAGMFMCVVAGSNSLIPFLFGPQNIWEALLYGTAFTILFLTSAILPMKTAERDVLILCSWVLWLFPISLLGLMLADDDTQAFRDPRLAQMGSLSPLLSLLLHFLTSRRSSRFVGYSR